MTFSLLEKVSSRKKLVVSVPTVQSHILIITTCSGLKSEKRGKLGKPLCLPQRRKINIFLKKFQMERAARFLILEHYVYGRKRPIWQNMYFGKFNRRLVTNGDGKMSTLLALSSKKIARIQFANICGQQVLIMDVTIHNNY